MRTNTRYIPPAGVVIPPEIDITISRNFAFINDRRVGTLKRSHRRSPDGVYQWHYTPECGPGVNAKADARFEAIYEGLVKPLLKQCESNSFNLAELEAQSPATTAPTVTASAIRSASSRPAASTDPDDWTSIWSHGHRAVVSTVQGRVFATRIS